MRQPTTGPASDQRGSGIAAASFRRRRFSGVSWAAGSPERPFFAMSNVSALTTAAAPVFGGTALNACLADVRRGYLVVLDERVRRIGLLPEAESRSLGRHLRHLGTLAPIYPEWLGDRRFAEAHGCRFAYVVGEMARGVATANMVVAAGRAGLLGFFGAAGLPPRAHRPGDRHRCAGHRGSIVGKQPHSLPQRTRS